MNGASPYVVDLEHAFVSESISLLEDAGLKLHVEREIGSATRDAAVDAAAIERVCSRFSSGQPDVFVTIGSGISTAVRLAHKETPQVFLAVTDPIASQLARSLDPDSSRGPVAGITFSITAEDRLRFINDVFHPRVLGFAHNPDYLADVHQLQAFTSASQLLETGARIVVRPIECRSPEISEEQQQGCDVLAGWLYFHEHIGALIKQATVPVVGGGWVDLRKGASCCISDDEREMGRYAARRILAEYLLDRKPLSLMPIYRLQGRKAARLFTGFNLDAAARWNLTFPSMLLDQANCVLQEQQTKKS